MSTKNLPTSSPAEIVPIAPEFLEIANCYLQHQDANAVAEELDVPIEVVMSALAKTEIKRYINQVFFDVGFNNRFKMRSAMDAIIKKKFSEMEEAEVGSNKDIIEILTLSHKMTKELMELEIALENAKNGGPKSQVNVQINEAGSNYGSLIEKLIKSEQQTIDA